MYGYVYRTDRISTGEIYIGQRKGKFDPKYFGSGTRIRRLIKKNGKSDLLVGVLQYALTAHDLDELEMIYIKEAKELYRKELILNILNGANEYMEGLIHSKESKVKMSKSRSGPNNWLYGRGDLLSGKGNPMFGKKHSVETKTKISEANKKKAGPNHGNRGKVRSAETRALISQKNKGKKRSFVPERTAEQNAKQSATMKALYASGKLKMVISKETLEKMSKSMKAARARKFWNSKAK